MHEQAKEKIINSAGFEIATANIYIGFYEMLAEKEENKEKKAGHLVKVDQMKAAILHNQTLLDYVNTL